MRDSFLTFLLLPLCVLVFALMWTSGDEKHPPRGDCTIRRYSVASPTSGAEWFGISIRTCTDTTEAPHAER